MNKRYGLCILAILALAAVQEAVAVTGKNFFSPRAINSELFMHRSFFLGVKQSL